MPKPYIFTTGSIAKHYGCREWQVRRVFERGLVPEPHRLGSYRVILAVDLPKIEQALRDAGYLPKEAAHAG